MARLEDGQRRLRPLLGHRQDVPISSLPLPTPAPAGAEWIAAYRRRLGGA